MTESDGYIVRYHAAGGVVVQDERVLVLLRPARGEVRLPKGHIEPGEDARAAALREVQEESGYDRIELGQDLGEQVVTFRRKGQTVVRTERYFLARLLPGATIVQSEPQFQALWVSWDEALARLTYEGEREWVRIARSAITARPWVRQPAKGVRCKLALSTGSLYTYGTARVFELAARAGFEWVEVLIDRRWDTRQAGYLQRIAQESGVGILVLHSPFDPAVPGWPSDPLGRLKHTVQLAQQLEVRVVVAHLPARWHTLVIEWSGQLRHQIRLPVPACSSGGYANFLVQDLASFEATAGVTVAVENMPARRTLGCRYNGYRYNSPNELERFAHLTLDTTHLGTWGLDPVTVYGQLRDRVVHVHLSNFDGREHRSPPDGCLPLARLLNVLARDAYSGTISVESDPSALDADDESRCLAALRRARSYCQEHLAGD